MKQTFKNKNFSSGTIVAIKNREELKREKLHKTIKDLRNDNMRMLTEILQRDAIINELKSKM